MERHKVVAGNWKMNMDYEQGRELTLEILDKLNNSKVLVVLCPPAIHLKNLSNIAYDVSNVRVGAQNCHQAEAGAYTGELSASMIASTGAKFVIIGHSERRAYFGEDGPLLAKKIDAALAAGLKPIFCCGEPLEVREAKKHEALVAKQIEEALFHLDEAALRNLVIAYEPVWAIGTGKTATPKQAQEMHAAIRKIIADKFGQPSADQMHILYGGSVKPGNAKEIFSKPDVDGGLIGGASLKADDFIAIVNAAI